MHAGRTPEFLRLLPECCPKWGQLATAPFALRNRPAHFASRFVVPADLGHICHKGRQRVDCDILRLLCLRGPTSSVKVLSQQVRVSHRCIERTKCISACRVFPSQTSKTSRRYAKVSLWLKALPQSGSPTACAPSRRPGQLPQSLPQPRAPLRCAKLKPA